MSKRIRKLSDRLRKTEPNRIPDADWDALNEYRASYVSAMLDVLKAVQQLPLAAGCAIAARLKNPATIVDKLRAKHFQLHRLDDIAGVRLTLPSEYGRREQHALVFELMARFPGSKIVDRIASPRSGYRAMHVIVNSRGETPPDDRRVEVQIRTRPQNLWAQMFEGIADQWGRQIRYGQPPTPGIVTFGDVSMTRAELVEILVQTSEFVSDFEEAEFQGQGPPLASNGIRSAMEDLQRSLAAVPFLHSPHQALRLEDLVRPDGEVAFIAVKYRRASGELVSLEPIENTPSALQEFAREARTDEDLEVVLLASKSPGALNVTHARFFRPPSDL